MGLREARAFTVACIAHPEEVKMAGVVMYRSAPAIALRAVLCLSYLELELLVRAGQYLSALVDHAEAKLVMSLCAAVQDRRAAVLCRLQERVM
jgi:hypothetical protein